MRLTSRRRQFASIAPAPLRWNERLTFDGDARGACGTGIYKKKKKTFPSSVAKVDVQLIVPHLHNIMAAPTPATYSSFHWNRPIVAVSSIIFADRCLCIVGCCATNQIRSVPVIGHWTSTRRARSERPLAVVYGTSRAANLVGLLLLPLLLLSAKRPTTLRVIVESKPDLVDVSLLMTTT